jgi:stress-induced morphogen
MNAMQSCIEAKLRAIFDPLHLEVLNESYMHAVPVNSETHFKVVLVSPSFVAKRQVQRHQLVYACLAQELKAGVHALALHTYSPDEWAATGVAPSSPACMGGSARES